MIVSGRITLTGRMRVGMERLPYWISVLGGNIVDSPAGITSFGNNIYVAGHTTSQGSGGQDFLVVKYDTNGSVVWQKALGGATYDNAFGIAHDSLGNVYATGYTQGPGTVGLADLLVVKYNSLGVIQWQKTLGGTDNEQGNGIAVDLSNNIYVVGTTYSTSGTGADLLLAKYNSSGTVQWQRLLGTVQSDGGKGVTIDTLGNIYVTGSVYAGPGAGNNDLLLAKYNSSGTVQWQRLLGGTNAEVGYGVATDSLNNIYVVGSVASQGSGSYDMAIIKYNSAGTVQWQRGLGTTTIDQGYSITIDATDNFYITGYTQGQGAGGNDLLLAKYNSSGTIQWQRTFGSTSAEIGAGIALDSDNNLCLTGYTYNTGGGDWLTIKLPNDGSMTGTYGVFTYQISTLVPVTTTLTSTTVTLTSTTPTLTSLTSTLPETTTTLVNTITPI